MVIHWWLPLQNHDVILRWDFFLDCENACICTYIYIYMLLFPSCVFGEGKPGYLA